MSGTPGVEQRHRRGADRAHRGRAVGAERLGDLADRVGELLARRQHRDERPLGERAVADLAALGRAHPAGLTGRVRRHVVVVHVALGALRVERVDHLLHAEHVQRGDAQDLGLAALEQRRAVHPGQHADLGRERPDVGQAAAVDAEPVVDDPLADQLLGQRPDGGADLLLAALELLRQPLLREGLDPVLLGRPLLLGRDGQRLGELVGDRAGDRLEDVIAVVGEDRELATWWPGRARPRPPRRRGSSAPGRAPR